MGIAGTPKGIKLISISNLASNSKVNLLSAWNIESGS